MPPPKRPRRTPTEDWEHRPWAPPEDVEEAMALLSERLCTWWQGGPRPTEASYGSVTKHLHDAFSLDERHSAVTVRNHTLQAARRAEQQLGSEHVMFIEGCQTQWDHLPIPDGPLAVGVDGGIVRARRGSTHGKGHLFEVIAGKSILSFRRDDPEDRPPSSKYFASVGLFDTKPKRRLFDLLTAQGMQANQQVTVFTDGATPCRKQRSIYTLMPSIFWTGFTSRCG